MEHPDRFFVFTQAPQFSESGTLRPAPVLAPPQLFAVTLSFASCAASYHFTFSWMIPRLDWRAITAWATDRGRVVTSAITKNDTATTTTPPLRHHHHQRHQNERATSHTPHQEQRPRWRQRSAAATTAISRGKLAGGGLKGPSVVGPSRQPRLFRAQAATHCSAALTPRLGTDTPPSQSRPSNHPSCDI